MMMVENSFDRWRKDVFFSAAEEVQESADIMESVFRAWERVRRDGFESNESDELCRELRTALGTTKWQLEEFERAVKVSHVSGSEHTIARHRQFVLAIEDQVSRIEKALRDSLIEEGKQPLRWVQLDEEERDDLALFLSGPPGSSQDMDNYVNLGLSKDNFQQKADAELGADANQERSRPDPVKGFKEIVTINNDAKYVVELEAKEVPGHQDEIERYRERLDEQKTTWSSPDMGSWRIVISDEDVVKKTAEEMEEIPTHADNLCGLLRCIDPVAKLKWFRNSFGKEKDEEHLRSGRALNYLSLRGMIPFAQGINLFNGRSRNCFSSCREVSNVSRVRQLFGRVGGFKRQVQGSQYYTHFSRSLQVTLVLVLTILLLVPFMFHSN
eukprot:TRINITY_DN1818_c1_g1_i1.p1 TRINITY_DN1818_c1_g1~~TRINITY_DN1818_c1_g1_i1.p1  ORF type:complete len:384 (+),score=80.29 TRINITY_DN1818_c1_g1_i1:369-1520(+)